VPAICASTTFDLDRVCLPSLQVNVTAPNDQQLRRIFGTILNAKLSDFDDEVGKAMDGKPLMHAHRSPHALWSWQGWRWQPLMHVAVPIKFYDPHLIWLKLCSMLAMYN
jgi:hypothetical protein